MTQEAPPTIFQLLAEFPKKEYCSAWAKPAKQLELLTTFLWLRQLVPTLPLDAFLNHFAKVADFDKINCKHPDTAVETYLPSGKKAEGQHNWTIDQRLDMTTAFVEMVFEAERTGQVVPMTFTDFVRNEAMRKMCLDGGFARPAEPKAKKKKTEVAAPAPSVTVNLFDRCVYNHPDGRQFRGQLTNINPEGDGEGDFQADSGELFSNVPLTLLDRITDDGPRVPTTDNGAPKNVIETQRLYINKPDTLELKRYQASSGAIGIVPVDTPIKTYTAAYAHGGYIAMVEVVNQSPIYIDARLTTKEGMAEGWSVAEVPPRDNIEGSYSFETDDGIVMLEIRTWKESSNSPI